MESNSLSASSVLFRSAGLLVLALLGWFAVLKPAWFGLRQMFGRVDPMAEAMKGIREGLRCVFADVRVMGRATDDEAAAAAWVARARSICRDYKVRWVHHLESLEDYPANELAAAIHGFRVWLRSLEVAPLMASAGCRPGQDEIAAARRLQLRRLVKARAPSLEHGAWYGLYTTMVFQLLVMEGLYVWGHRTPLYLAAGILAYANLFRLQQALRGLFRVWPVRREAAAIVATVGIPDLPTSAVRLMAGQALGVTAMLLLGIRSLAMGAALRGPGSVLCGLNRTLAWTWSFYLQLAHWTF